ncbi:MAG: hypothetical protein JWO25_1398 [Alphaproteobacteria bacterium]|nr:hypothetical protein [Alphaproteobacteria bacterium]
MLWSTLRALAVAHGLFATLATAAAISTDRS